MRILFYGDTSVLVFDISREVLVEVFEFGRNANQIEDFNQLATSLFRKFKNDAEYVDGDPLYLLKAYSSFVNGISKAPEEIAGYIKGTLNDFSDDGHDHLILGELCVARSANSRTVGFSVDSVSKEEFDERSAAHLAMFKAEQMGTVGHA